MSAEPITSGLMLGRYELLVPIAKGGTASVWAARLKGSRNFQKIVAIKVMLLDDAEDTDAETMFIDEAQLVSRIRHANVAEVIDFGEAQGALFMAMEWVDGEPLTVLAREAHRRGGVPLPIIGQIATQASAGLHAAHDLRDAAGTLVGLVHRDVSPQNILVGYDGMVKIIDFGVAKAASNQLRTSVGQLKGKVGYMAPEQAFGEPVDRRTDVFALGIVLYQLITGKHPFRGDNEFATLGRIRDKRPVDGPGTLIATLPAAIDAVICRALSKNRGERYATMMDFSRALEQAFPPLENGRDDLAAFMRALLGARGEKKRIAIREVVSRVDANQPAPTVVPAAFEASKSMDVEEGSAHSDATPPPPVAKGSAQGALFTAPASQGFSPALLEEPLPDFRPRRLALKVVAAATAIVLALALAIWGASESSTSAPGTDAASPVGKKPW